MALVRLVSEMEDSDEMLAKIFALAGVGDPKGNVLFVALATQPGALLAAPDMPFPWCGGAGNAYRSFSDQDSLRLIETAASVLGMTVDDVIVGTPWPELPPPLVAASPI
jgi:hypothetical protein